jgi:Tol biopolymer transport system component
MMFAVVTAGLSAQATSSPPPPDTPLGQQAPGVGPRVFARGIVTVQDFIHCSITMTPDGGEVYWAITPEEGSRNIYVSRRGPEGWSEPMVVPFADRDDGDCPMVTPDGRQLFFNSFRYLHPARTAEEAPGAEDRERLWVVDLNDTGPRWSEPHAPEAINDAHLHWQASADSKGTLYFGSRREGGLGKTDIYVSHLRNAGYTTPVNLGETINTQYLETAPFVAPDGSYLIFSRGTVLESPSDAKLYISFLTAEGVWDDPVPLSATAGYGTNEVAAYVSPDGRFLFFMRISNRGSEVYWMDASVIERLRQDR